MKKVAALQKQRAEQNAGLQQRADKDLEVAVFAAGVFRGDDFKKQRALGGPEKAVVNAVANPEQRQNRQSHVQRERMHIQQQQNFQQQ